jgi:hypothetical protein
VRLISHVTEMADAIPVQIKIEKGRAGASRLVVPGADPLLANVEPLAEAQVDKRLPAAVCNAVKAATLVLAPEEQAERAQALLSRLREAGGKSGNQSLREALGWNEGTYEAVKANLLAGGQLIAGKGRGGSVAVVTYD